MLAKNFLQKEDTNDDNNRNITLIFWGAEEHLGLLLLPLMEDVIRRVRYTLHLQSSHSSSKNVIQIEFMYSFLVTFNIYKHR